MLTDVDLSIDAMIENQIKRKKDQESPLFSIFGEFRELSIRHLTLEGSADEDEPSKIQNDVLRSLKILFDITAAYLFFYDPDNNLLIGKTSGVGGRETYIGHVHLPVVPDGSLPALALSQRKIFDSFGYLSNDLVTIADEQLIHLLKTEGMLCIPLVHRQKLIGVICAGIDEPQFPLLWEQINLLNLFAGQAAAVLEKVITSDMRSQVTEEISETVGDDAIRRVIHEVNNPLGIVKNYLKVLSTKIGEHPGVQDEIGLIREEIDRIPGIIAQLSKSQYKQDTDDEPVDINSILYDLSKLLTRSVLEHANISLNFSPDPRLPLFSGKKSNLIQVFINLLKNSVEAMPAGGNIDMATFFEEPANGKTGGKIVITIRDDGPGLPDDVLARLFEPGLSSKGPEHFGLGLSISKEIISKYTGVMQCESHKDKGTSFRITLPVSG
jgi:signal transduction histidine kinase